MEKEHNPPSTIHRNSKKDKTFGDKRGGGMSTTTAAGSSKCDFKI